MERRVWHPRAGNGNARRAVVDGWHRDIDTRTTRTHYLDAGSGVPIVLLHGSGSTRDGVLDHLAELARAGFGILAFDARGHGESDGTAMDWGWYGDRDTAAAVSFLEHRPDVERGRIGAVGLSMGGEEALTTAASDPRIRAVVAEGATMRAFSDWPNIPAPSLSRLVSARMLGKADSAWVSN